MNVYKINIEAPILDLSTSNTPAGFDPTNPNPWML